MKTIIKIFLMVVLTIGFFNEVLAQEQLVYTKKLNISNPNQIEETLSDLTFKLVDKTNAEVCAQCPQKDIMIIKGRIPLTLSKDPFSLDYTFNGYISYQLEVNYNDGIQLTFKNLTHESSQSTNGFDLDYGQLLLNGETSKNAVYRNYTFLAEDHPRITLFNTDKYMSEKIEQAAFDALEGLIAVK